MNIDYSKLITKATKDTQKYNTLIATIASRRYEEETKGITVLNMKVDTGRDSQGLIAGACLAAIIDPEYIVKWKCSNGDFIPLTAPQIITLATAVRAHVQACFDREHELLTAIEDGEFEETMLTEGWPNG